MTSWIVVSSAGTIFGFAMLFLMVRAGRYWSGEEWSAIIVTIVGSLLLTGAGTVLYLTWLYKAWDSLPPEGRKVSPGQAVGYLFIPFYNFYWVFRAVPGLSSELARALRARDGAYAGGAGYGIGLTAAIIAVIPYVNLLAWPFFVAWICAANAARNRLLSPSA